MRNPLRLSFGTLLLAISAACSRSADQQALSADLKADLAAVGGGSDVQLAGMTQPAKLEFVSAAERGESMTPSPKAKAVSKAPSNNRGMRAPVKSVRHETPAPAQPVSQADAVAAAEQPVAEPLPEPVQSRGRPSAPMPSTQREPPGGWRSPSEVIRNAPFPIKP
jgi:hypothetical protein